MSREDIENFIESLETLKGGLLADNLDTAFVGVDTEADTPRAVYSIQRCISKLAEDMPLAEAEEYFWFNVAGACGEGFPIYISTPEDISPYG